MFATVSTSFEKCSTRKKLILKIEFVKWDLDEIRGNQFRANGDKFESHQQCIAVALNLKENAYKSFLFLSLLSKAKTVNEYKKNSCVSSIRWTQPTLTLPNSHSVIQQKGRCSNTD